MSRDSALALIAELNQCVVEAELAQPLSLDRAAARAKKDTFEVLLLGEFSRGKSTLINALLGMPLLPKGLRPTTAAITRVRRGPELRISWDGPERRESRQPKSLKEASEVLKTLATVAGDPEAIPEIVDVEVPTGLDSGSLVLVDTPGTQDLDGVRDEITYRYLPNADAALFLLDAGKPLTETERIFLCDRVFPRDLHRLIFVVNKIDTADGGEDIIRRTRARLKEQLPIADPLIVRVSGKSFLAAQLAGDAAAQAASGGLGLSKALHDYLQSGPARLQAENVRRLLKSSVVDLLSQIDVRLSLLTEEQGHARETLAREQAQIQGVEGQLAEAQSALKDDEHHCRERLQEAMSSALNLLRGQLEFAFSVSDMWALRSGIARVQRELMERVLRAVNDEVERARQLAGIEMSAVRPDLVGAIPEEQWDTELGMEVVGYEATSEGEGIGSTMALAGATAGLILGAATGGLGIGLVAAVLGFLGGQSASKEVQLRQDKGRLRRSADLWLTTTEARLASWVERIVSELRSRTDAQVIAPVRTELERRLAGNRITSDLIEQGQEVRDAEAEQLALLKQRLMARHANLEAEDSA